MTRLDWERRQGVRAELPETCRVLRLRFNGNCHECEATRHKGSLVIYDKAIRKFYCWECGVRLGWVNKRP